MARMVLTIDGEPLDMLLDSGAMAELGPDGAAALQLAPGTVVGASHLVLDYPRGIAWLRLAAQARSRW